MPSAACHHSWIGMLKSKACTSSSTIERLWQSMTHHQTWRKSEFVTRFQNQSKDTWTATFLSYGQDNQISSHGCGEIRESEIHDRQSSNIAVWSTNPLIHCCASQQLFNKICQLTSMQNALDQSCRGSKEHLVAHIDVMHCIGTGFCFFIMAAMTAVAAVIELTTITDEHTIDKHREGQETDKPRYWLALGSAASSLGCWRHWEDCSAGHQGHHPSVPSKPSPNSSGLQGCLPLLLLTLGLQSYFPFHDPPAYYLPSCLQTLLRRLHPCPCPFHPLCLDLASEPPNIHSSQHLCPVSLLGGFWISPPYLHHLSLRQIDFPLSLDLHQIDCSGWDRPRHQGPLLPLRCHRSWGLPEGCIHWGQPQTHLRSSSSPPLSSYASRGARLHMRSGFQHAQWPERVYVRDNLTNGACLGSRSNSHRDPSCYPSLMWQAKDIWIP